MALRAHLHDVYPKHLFAVEIDGVEAAGFAKCSPLGWDIEEKEYTEASNPTATRRLRRFTKLKDITLERGVVFDASLQKWAEENANYPIGGTSKRNVTILLLDRTGAGQRFWTYEEAWVKEFEIGDFDSMSNEVLIEKLVIVAERLIAF